MKNDKTIKGGLTVQTAIKAGGLSMNHNARALKIRSGVKAAGLSVQHNRRALKARA